MDMFNQLVFISQAVLKSLLNQYEDMKKPGFALIVTEHFPRYSDADADRIGQMVCMMLHSNGYRAHYVAEDSAITFNYQKMSSKEEWDKLGVHAFGEKLLIGEKHD